MAKPKGVFTGQLDDLDELLPPPIPRPSAAPAPATAHAPEPEQSAPVAGSPTVEPLVTASASEPPTPTPQLRPRRRRPASATPTAEVAPEVYKALRKLTNREKARNPITARTYAQVVLDAIEEGQEELSTFWTQAATGAGSGGGLFSRRPATPMRRRRHAEPTGRVPLTGLNPDDSDMLNSLIDQWQAPSRSALVEQALRFYEPLWPNPRRGKRSVDDDYDDETAATA